MEINDILFFRKRSNRLKASFFFLFCLLVSNNDYTHTHAFNARADGRKKDGEIWAELNDIVIKSDFNQLCLLSWRGSLTEICGRPHKSHDKLLFIKKRQKANRWLCVLNLESDQKATPNFIRGLVTFKKKGGQRLVCLCLKSERFWFVWKFIAFIGQLNFFWLYNLKSKIDLQGKIALHL